MEEALSKQEFENEEEEYDPELDQILREAEEANRQSYVFDPDIDEEAEYDPGYYMRKGRRVWSPRVGRRRRRTTRRRPTRRARARAYIRRRFPRLRRYYGAVRKRIPTWVIAVPAATVAFLFSLQQLCMKSWMAEGKPATNAFRWDQIVASLGGFWGRPKNLITYVKNIFSSPFSLAGLALAVYALLPFKRLPLKRLALMIGGAFLLGSLVGSAFHESDNPGNPNSHSETSTSTSTHDPFKSVYR